MEAIHPKYKTFWRRFAASIIDGLVLSPIFLIEWLIFGKVETGQEELVVFLINFLVFGFYSVNMTGLHGGTVGKKAMGLQVLDGNDEASYIGFIRALKRDSPLLISEVLAIMYMVVALENNPAGFDDQDPIIRNLDNLTGIWFIAELITMLGNERRRAIHDILANSVVVKQVQEEAIPE
jgi:uncharacterized RDD family membrane protein YckC